MLDLNEHYEKIYTFCYFRIKNKQVAEDLTQETFLKYFENDYIEKGKKLAFLYTIARNLCIDYYRKNKYTQNAQDIDDLKDILVSKSVDIETVLTVKSAVETLTIEEQEIVLLRFTNELAIGEIANYLKISRFSLYRKIKTIMKKLNQELKKEDFYE